MMGDLQVSADLKLREHSGQLNKTVLLPAAGCQFPKEGAKASEEYLQEMKENPGEDLGSPHAKLGLNTIMALLGEMTTNPGRWKPDSPEKKAIDRVHNW